MKVFVEGPDGRVKNAIENRLIFNGDTVDPKGKKLRVSTFEGLALADLTAEAVFEQSPEEEDRREEVYHLIHRFDGEHLQEQVVLSLLLNGSSGEGLGADVVTGSVMKFLRKLSWYNEEKLVTLLQEMGFKGFVTLECEGLRVRRIFLGIPNLAAFGLVEKLIEPFHTFDDFEKVPSFNESWTAALLITAFPFPYNDRKTEFEVKGIHRGVLRHFWPFEKKVSGESYISSDNAVGVVTAFEWDLSALERRLMTTCENITFPQKQYRMDVKRTIERKLGRVERFLL